VEDIIRTLKDRSAGLDRADVTAIDADKGRSDLVKFGHKHRRADGLQIKVGKLRDKVCDPGSCIRARPRIDFRQFGGLQSDKVMAEVPGPKGLNPKPARAASYGGLRPTY
jgi:hypothetical protein